MDGVTLRKRVEHLLTSCLITLQVLLQRFQSQSGIKMIECTFKLNPNLSATREGLRHLCQARALRVGGGTGVDWPPTRCVQGQNTCLHSQSVVLIYHLVHLKHCRSIQHIHIVKNSAYSCKQHSCTRNIRRHIRVDPRTQLRATRSRKSLESRWV